MTLRASFLGGWIPSALDGAFRIQKEDCRIYLVFPFFNATICASKSSVDIRSELDFPT